MDILLVNPPWLTKGGIWQQVASCIPPFGLAQIASYLEEKKISVKLLDADALKLSHSEIANLFRCKKEPSFIGITATTSTINSAIKVAELSREIFKNAKIVMGGIHPSIMPAEVLMPGLADFVVRNEGEETFLELVAGAAAEKIAGLSYKRDNRIIDNPARPVIENMDSLPLPAYHLLPMEKYFPALGSYKKLPASGMITSRGCPGRCTFCCGDYLGRKIRSRSAEKIFDEIQLLYDKYNIREISFYDDVFTTRKENVKNLCKRLINEKLDISWSCFARADFVDEDLLRAMKDAGCHQIMYGIESGDEEILKNIQKKVSLEKAEYIVKLTQRLGIDVRAAFMLGNPGETEESMEKTINYAVEIDPEVVIFNITTPYPGSEMFKWAKKNKYLRTEDWDEYDLSKPIMDLPELNSKKVLEYYNKAYKKFYLRLKYLLKRIFKIRSLLDIKVGFVSLFAIIKR